MVLSSRIVKCKKTRSERALAKKGSKVHENDKSTNLIKGGQVSETVHHFLRDMQMLKRPNVHSFSRKNTTRPFEDQTLLEFFSKKTDASLFAFGCHSKKRPHNVVIGRMFNYHVLDMVEFGVRNFRSLMSFDEKPQLSEGNKPCLVFNGELFDSDPEYQRIKSLLMDFFRGVSPKSVRLDGFENVLQFTAINGKVLLRNYRIKLKKSGTRIPHVQLQEMGPAVDLEVRRTKLASNDLFKQACKTPKNAKPKKKKNIAHDPFGSKTGRIHMTTQDYAKLQTRKMKGLKKNTPMPQKPEEEDGEEGEEEVQEPRTKRRRVQNREEEDME